MRYEFNIEFDCETRHIPRGNHPEATDPKTLFIAALDSHPVIAGNYTLKDFDLNEGWLYCIAKIGYDHPGEREHARRILWAEITLFPAFMDWLTGATE